MRWTCHKCKCTCLIVYSPDIPSVQQTTIYTLVLEHTLLQSHLLCGEFTFTHCVAVNANQYNLPSFLSTSPHIDTGERKAIPAYTSLPYSNHVSLSAIFTCTVALPMLKSQQ